MKFVVKQKVVELNISVDYSLGMNIAEAFCHFQGYFKVLFQVGVLLPSAGSFAPFVYKSLEVHLAGLCQYEHFYLLVECQDFGVLCLTRLLNFLFGFFRMRGFYLFG